MELHEKIAKVRETLTERGLAKSALERLDTGQVCLRGALGVALCGSAYAWDRVSTREVDEFLNGLAEKRGWRDERDHRGLGLGIGLPAHVNFNNDPHTIESDVIEFLHEAEIAAKELHATS